MNIKEIASEMMKPRNLSTIIERKKEEFEAISENFDFDSHDFLEKAIRESVEEALREVLNPNEVRRHITKDLFGIKPAEFIFIDAIMDRVKEFMK